MAYKKNKLFDIDTSSKQSSNINQAYFHFMVVRFLFAAKRAQQDIQVVVAFLYIRVSQPTKQVYQNWGM